PLLVGWHNPPREGSGSWTPDGKYYVFISVADGTRSLNIFAVPDSAGLFRRSSRKPVQLTFGPLAYWGTVSDRKHLLVGGFDNRGELERYDMAAKQLVPYLGGISATQVAFSKDEKWIAYISLVDNSLWVSRIDGTAKLQLTYPPNQAALPRWSPDGSKVSFMSAQPGKPWKIFVISGQGGTPEELLPQDTSESDPGWSPDGHRLVFSRLVSGRPLHCCAGFRTDVDKTLPVRFSDPQMVAVGE
ncbi:MAG TPA: hypothetical protein VLC51_04905, partial [Nitrospira sp.]|nr:hypothetical protein [Nitrospira sp.]